MSDRQRMLKNVEETAEAMRMLNMLTKPILKEIHRREAELCDERVLERCDSDDFKDSSPSDFDFSSPLKLTEPVRNMRSSSDESPGALPVSPGFRKRKSVWSPIKHAKVVDTESVLKTEKTPVWVPLRKSKARQSLSCNLENLKSPVVSEGLLNSPNTSIYTANSETEPRTPLKLMIGVHSNQTSSKTGASEDTSVMSLKESSPLDTTPIPESTIFENDVAPLVVENGAAECTPVKGATSITLTSKPTEEMPPSLDSGLGMKTPSSHFKSICSPVRCSPVLLQAYGEEIANVRGSIGSPDKVINLKECSASVDPSKVLKGVNAYVEVRRGEDDRTGGFRWKLKQLGATISDTLNKKVTHVVFQEGLLSTYRKAKQLDIPLVSAQWVMACDESFTRVSEQNYPIEKLDQYELADPLTKYIRRPKVMSPDLGSGRDDKRLSRRFQRIRRKTMQILSPLVLTDKEPAADENPVDGPMNLPSEPSKSFETDEDQNSDDDDGFLAMLEAQVRDKAASRLKKEEAEKAVKEFKAQLETFLGRKKNTNDDKDDGTCPGSLPKMFQPDEALSSAQCNSDQDHNSTKTSRPMSSASIMKNWLLQYKSYESSKAGDGTQAKLDTEAAVDALSDEILDSMIATPSSKPILDVKDRVNSSCSAQKPLQGPSASSHLATEAVKEKAPSVPARSRPKSSQSGVKRSVKAKQNVQESKASSLVMQNWLSKGKSPSPTTGGCQETPKKKFKKSPRKNLPLDICGNLNESHGSFDKALLPSNEDGKDASTSTKDVEDLPQTCCSLSSKLDVPDIQDGSLAQATPQLKSLKRKVSSSGKKTPSKKKRSPHKSVLKTPIPLQNDAEGLHQKCFKLNDL